MSLKKVHIEGIEYYTDLDDNVIGMSHRGLARLCKVDNSTIVGIVKKLNITTLSFKPLKIIPLDSCKHIAMKYLIQNKGNELTCKFLGIPNKFIKNNNKNKNTTEASIRDKLKETMGGSKEVITLAGNIDLLTSVEIIEVKNVKSWKHALGQILVYSMYYPSHQKRIHLFGETTSSYLDLIKQHCKKFNVKVTCEN